MTDIHAIARHCDELLVVDAVSDYCPNGLQALGRRPVTRLVSGVTASLALIDAAARDGADAILVHHGWFWKGDDPRLIGMHGRRVAAYDPGPADADGLLWCAELTAPLSGPALAAHVAERLGRAPLHVPVIERDVRRIAWCTGAAQRFIERAADLGADLYLSGEVSEQTVHQARELGIDYIAAGHHATERYGVAALGDHVAERFGLVHRFVDIDNPA